MSTHIHTNKLHVSTFMLPRPVLYLATYIQLLSMYVLQLPIKTLHLKS
uniref:Uncharacterized protein n=1 Tax=Anguilla anguilla TaxID=7936 RepID=A0A0E9P7W6_ANGAN